MKKFVLFTAFSLMVVLVVSACTTSEPETLEVTRIVEVEGDTQEVEVTRVVEAEALIVRVARAFGALDGVDESPDGFAGWRHFE